MQDWLHAILVKAQQMLGQFGPVKTAMLGSIGGLIASRRWLIEQHDGKILKILHEARQTAEVAKRPGQHTLYLPFPFHEIAKDAKRSQKSVRRSLRRLETRGYVHEVRDGWNLGPRPEPLTLSSLLASSQMRAPSRWQPRW
jgi:hypothetical protein